jgi:hypothetical protein
MEIAGTPEQALVFLDTHWGSKYLFALPERPGANWTATAKFGAHDRLQALSPAALLDTIRAHYQSHQGATTTF